MWPVVTGLITVNRNLSQKRINVKMARGISEKEKVVPWLFL